MAIVNRRGFGFRHVFGKNLVIRDSAGMPSGVASGTRPGRVIVSERRRWEAALATLVVFLGGYNVTLPVNSLQMPFWLTPLQAVHGIFVDDLLVIAYACAALVRPNLLRIRLCPRMLLLAGSLALLGLLGMLSAMINLLPQDAIKALRLLYSALYLAVLVHWTRAYGVTFLLRCLTVGLLSGALINLYFSFAYPFAKIGPLPFLHGQAGPGSGMGMMVLLGALLAGISRDSKTALLGVVVAAVGALGTVISFSKIALAIAALGALVWARQVVGYCLFSVRLSARGRVLVVVGVLGALTAVGAVVPDEYVTAANGFAQRKILGIGIGDGDNDQRRFLYFVAVTEIVTKNPVFGVSYSGFYEAVMDTEPARTGKLTEDPTAGADGSANPHSTILYYASASGMLGFFASVVIFLAFLSNAWVAGKRSGRVAAFALAGSQFVLLMTIPTLFFYKPFLVAAAILLDSEHGVVGSTSATEKE